MITRTQFVDSFVKSGTEIDVDALDCQARSCLTEAGVSVERLRSIAGQDKTISTSAEYHRLFDLLDDLDRNGSRNSIATTSVGLDGVTRLSDACAAMSMLLQTVEDQRLRAQLGFSRTTDAAAEAPWLSIVKGELGQKEVAGSVHNPRILEYHRSTHLNASTDETPWCASFVNWVMERAGIKGTDSASALSWLKWGKEISSPAVGSIAVIDWGNNKGHVGFVVGKNGDRIVLAGGNQGNQVKYSTYRLDQITSFRVPTGYEVPNQDWNLPFLNVRIANENLASTR